MYLQNVSNFVGLWYGIDWNGPVPVYNDNDDDDGAVVVDDLPPPLSATQQQALTDQLPPSESLTEDWMITTYTIANVISHALYTRNIFCHCIEWQWSLTWSVSQHLLLLCTLPNKKKRSQITAPVISNKLCSSGSKVAMMHRPKIAIFSQDMIWLCMSVWNVIHL